jgi:hypothetical protein
VVFPLGVGRNNVFSCSKGCRSSDRQPDVKCRSMAKDRLLPERLGFRRR